MTSSIGSNPSGQLPPSGPSIQNEQDQPDNCGICLEPMLQDEVIKKIACEHFYHQSCIDKWLMVANTCPQCRQKADPDAPQFRAPEMTQAELLAIVAGLDGIQAPHNNQIPFTSRMRNVRELGQRVSEHTRRQRLEMYGQMIATFSHVATMELQLSEIQDQDRVSAHFSVLPTIMGSMLPYLVTESQVQRAMHESHIPENNIPIPASPPVNPDPNPVLHQRIEFVDQDIRILERNSELNRNSPLLNTILEWERQRNGILFDVD